MIDAPFAHLGGIPVEETIGSFGPVIAVWLGVAWAKLRSAPSSRRPHRKRAGPRRTSPARARRMMR